MTVSSLSDHTLAGPRQEARRRHARSICLLSHLPYYRHAALALDTAGLLQHYLQDPTLLNALPGASLPAVGRYVERINRSRIAPDLEGLPRGWLWIGRIGSVVVPTMERVVSPRHRPPERGAGLALQSLLWDLDARRQLDHPSVLHFVSGIGEHAARRTIDRGGLVVCDARAPHARAHLETTVPSLASRGIAYRLPNEVNLARLEREYRLADVIVCNSEYTRRSFLQQGFDPDKVVSVLYGCDTSAFRPATKEPDQFTVLFAGRERLRKGFLDLADAARSLPGTAQVLVTGSPDELSTAAVADVDATVTFLGPVTPDLMPSIYRRSSVFVLPSLSEGFGLVVTEAMAAGLPVIVSDHTGAGEVVTDGVNGFVVPAADPDAIADRLQTLAADPDLRASMGAAARRAAVANDWTVYGHRLVEIYDRHVLPSVPVSD